MGACRVSFLATLPILLGGLVATAPPAMAADPNPPVRERLAEPIPPVSPWQFEFRPYAWVLYIEGESRLGANKTDIDTNLFEIIDEADELYAFMSYQEARKGRLGLFADVFWSKINVGGSTVKSRNPIAGLKVTIVADADVWFDLAIVEPGMAFELARWNRSPRALKGGYGFTPTTALDVVAGARYWYMKPDIDLSVTATVSIPALGLSRTGGGAISAEKVIDWWDPFVGLRLRHKPTPGQELMLRADVGGFDVGSDITWQLAAGYSFKADFLGLPMTSYLGYRALYIDYEQGSGRRKFGLDTWWHGPVLGAAIRW